MLGPTIAAAVLAAAAFALPAAASASLANPAVTDPSGDALNSSGENQRAVDLRSGDVTIDGTFLTFRTTFSGRPVLDAVHTHSGSTMSPKGDSSFFGGSAGVPLLSSAVQGGAALTDGPPDPFGIATQFINVAGTAVRDGKALVVRYPLAELNRQLAGLQAPLVAPGIELRETRFSSANTSRRASGGPTSATAQDSTAFGAPFQLGPA